MFTFILKKLKTNTITVLVILLVGQSCSIAPRNQLTTTTDLHCQIINGKHHPLIGAEDFAYSALQNGLFISSSARRTAAKKGGLFWLDVSLPISQQVAIKLPVPNVTLIDPHGMDILEIDGDTFLYVITHEDREKGIHSLHQFKVMAKTKTNIPQLVFIKTMAFPLDNSPNDISVTAVNELFTSFDTVSSLGLVVQKVDSLLGLKRSKLSYSKFNAKYQTLSLAGFGNGILAEKQEDFYVLWWADMLTNQIQKITLTIVKGTAQIVSKKIIKLPSAPDNIMKGTDRKIYITTHYSFADFLDHKDNPKHPSPYVVYRLENDRPVEVYAHAGDQFSAGSTAVKIANTLYIGQVYNQGLKACHLMD